MKNILLVLVLGLVLVNSGCGPIESLQPIYTKSDLVMEPPLEGVWGGADKLTFTKSGEDGYKLDSSWDVHLVRLGGFLFLDIVPDQADVGGGSFEDLFPGSGPKKIGEGVYASLSFSRDGFYRLEVIRTHFIARVWLSGEQLCLTTLDKAPDDIPRLEKDILTAPTWQLQQFLIEHADDPEFFKVPEEHYRKVAEKP